MKKILAFLTAAILAAAVTGCANSGGTSQTAASSHTDDSWSKVQSSGQLVLGLDKAFPPMGFVDTKTGETVGFDIDLAKEACKRLNIKLKLQPIDWENKTAEINNGNVDCLWNGFSKTDGRMEEFNLSIPYMKNKQIILVKSGSDFKGLSSLSGKVIGVQSDSSAEAAMNDKANTAFKNSLNDVVKIDDYSKAVMEIQNGTVDAIAIDENVARYYLKNSPSAYTILQDNNGQDVSLAVEDYVVGFRKNGNELTAKIDGVLKEMGKDGTASKISQKWFGKDVITIGK